MRRKKRSLNDKQSLSNLIRDIFFEIDSLDEKVKSLEETDGSRLRPARSCSDLLLNNKANVDGWYWIDPNLGSKVDAIRVWCNMSSGGQTCVHPQRNGVSPQYWKKEEGKRWFSELSNGFLVS